MKGDLEHNAGAASAADGDDDYWASRHRQESQEFSSLSSRDAAGRLAGELIQLRQKIMKNCLEWFPCDDRIRLSELIGIFTGMEDGTLNTGDTTIRTHVLDIAARLPMTDGDSPHLDSLQIQDALEGILRHASQNGLTNPARSVMDRSTSLGV